MHSIHKRYVTNPHPLPDQWFACLLGNQTRHKTSLPFLQTNVGLPGKENDSGSPPSLLPPPTSSSSSKQTRLQLETTTVYYTHMLGLKKVHTYLSSVLWLLVDFLCLVHNQIHELIKALGRRGRKTFAVKTSCVTREGDGTCNRTWHCTNTCKCISTSEIKIHSL